MSWLHTIADFVAAHDVLWVSLWMVLGVITVVMFALMATRWRRSEPLHHCIVLSVWLHVLLAVYATSIHVLDGKPGRFRNLMVHLVSGDENVAEDDVAPSTGTPEWDRTTEPSVSEIDPSLLAPQETPEAPTVERAEVPDDATIETPPTSSLLKLDANLDLPKAEPESDDVPTEEAPQEENVDTEKATPQVATREPIAPVADAPGSPEEDAMVPAMLADAPAEAAPFVEPSVIAPPATIKSSASAVAAMAPVAELLDDPQMALPRATGLSGSHATPQIYAARLASDHTTQAERHGGSPDTEKAVKAALAWLSQSQSADGRWDASQFGSGQESNAQGQNRRGAGAHADTGITGLALLAFLGAGHTHTRGDYRPTVARGLDFLLRSQGAQGQLGGEAEVYALMYCHGMATLALSEAYAMSGDQRLLKPVRDAISYTVNAQNRVLGGWRYRPGDAGDTSQLGWQLMALKSAEQGGIPISAATRERMVRFLTAVSSGTYGGIASYRPNEKPSRTMTAEALVCRQFLGLAEPGRNATEAALFVVEELPAADAKNLYYWYYATLGLYQVQGPSWQRWNDALVSTLLASQRSDVGEPGSWDPDPVWGPYGGRVFATAMGAMCLEVYYRYLPLYVEAAKVDRPTR